MKIYHLAVLMLVAGIAFGCSDDAEETLAAVENTEDSTEFDDEGDSSDEAVVDDGDDEGVSDEDEPSDDGETGDDGTSDDGTYDDDDDGDDTSGDDGSSDEPVVSDDGFPAWMPDEFPVIAWRGVPKGSTSIANYQIMRDCGFNVNLAYFDTESQVSEALEVAEMTDMQLIAYWPSGWFTSPSRYVPKYDGDPALLSYFIADEPTADNISTLVERVTNIRDAGGSKPSYVNLNPYNSSKWTEKSYTAYVEDAVDELGLEYISYDFYPITQSGSKVSIRSGWYDNLRIVREIALERGLPWWGFVLTCPHSSYPDPTVDHFRLQINVNLAYGAQALEYFTYWLPVGESGDQDLGYFNPPVGEDGVPTDTYYKLQTANKELAEVAPLFYKGTITDVEKLSSKAQYGDATLGTASDGAIGSMLTTLDGDNYLVFVNLSLSNSITVTYRSTEYTIKTACMLLLPR